MGIISKHLCKCTICMYGTHAQNALDDPTRRSSVAGLDIWPVFALFVVKFQTLANIHFN